jgi:hypothetical protein
VIKSAITLATAAFIGAIGVALDGGEATAADQRYTMEACGDAKPCAFVLDTETGEVRYCDTAGCRVLDALKPVERPSPFPLPGQRPITGQAVQPLPLGEPGAAEPGVLEQLNRPPAAADGPSPFPYIEPAPRSQ